jgi:di/tricarboxylate transporter
LKLQLISTAGFDKVLARTQLNQWVVDHMGTTVEHHGFSNTGLIFFLYTFLSFSDKNITFIQHTRR